MVTNPLTSVGQLIQPCCHWFIELSSRSKQFPSCSNILYIMIETLIEWINGEPMHKTLALNYHHSQRVTMFTVYLPALITAIIATTTHTCSPCCQQIATHIQNTHPWTTSLESRIAPGTISVINLEAATRNTL